VSVGGEVGVGVLVRGSMAAICGGKRPNRINKAPVAIPPMQASTTTTARTPVFAGARRERGGMGG
jgi:hypothetical protein